jgi:acyl dehydratase
MSIFMRIVCIYNLQKGINIMKIFSSPHELVNAVGEHLGYSSWVNVSQDRINQFADATDDHQWIHIDPDKSRQGPFGQTIAHGFLTMSMVSSFMPMIFSVENIAMGINYGVNKVRFPSPVLVNSQIRGGAELISVEEIKGGIQVIIRVTVEIKDQEKPACIVETITRYYPK